MTFLTGQSWRLLKSWYTAEGSEQGFRRWLADGLTRGLVSSVAQAMAAVTVVTSLTSYYSIWDLLNPTLVVVTFRRGGRYTKG